MLFKIPILCVGLNHLSSGTQIAVFLGFITLLLCLGLSGCPQISKTPDSGTASRYLYIWMGDKDGKEDDFIAVVDVQEGSPTFGRFLAAQQVGLKGSMPHHLEYEIPSPGQLLYGNAHHHELLILVDFSKPLHPRIVKTVSPPPPYRYPHDITRLPNGHVLVGYLRSEGVLKEVEVEPQGQTAELAKQASEAERPEDRVKALKEFAHQAEPSVLGKVLVPALQDQDPRVRKLALQRMTDATDPPLEVMAEMVLRDERGALRSSAIDTLVSIHGAAATPTLEKALSDPSRAVRRAAQQGLERIRQMEERIIHKQQ
jgi:hypothetical protein